MRAANDVLGNKFDFEKFDFEKFDRHFVKLSLTGIPAGPGQELLSKLGCVKLRHPKGLIELK